MPPEPFASQITKRHIESLTGIRFYAALAVFVAHLSLFGFGVGLTEGRLLRCIESLGAMGVSVFFTLSGVIMVLNYVSLAKTNPRPKPIAPMAYWKARFARIYPAFVASYIAIVPLLQWMRSGQLTWANFFGNLACLRLFNITMPMINPPAWSIVAEVLFYALFPLTLSMLHRHFWKTWAAMLGGYSVFFVVLHLPGVAGGWVDADWLGPHSPYMRLFEFIGGVGLGGWLLRWHDAEHPLPTVSKPLLYGVLWVSVVSLLLGQIQIFVLKTISATDLTPVFFLTFLPGSLGLIGSLYALEVHHAQPLRWVRHPVAVWFGEVSYSFYLFHYPVLLLGLVVATSWWHLNPLALQGPLAWGLITALLLLTIGVSALSYYGIEAPARRWIRHWHRPAWLCRHHNISTKASSNLA